VSGFGEKRNVYKVLWKDLKERDCMEDLGLGLRIT
jgi:hypothetical protein